MHYLLCFFAISNSILRPTASIGLAAFPEPEPVTITSGTQRTLDSARAFATPIAVSFSIVAFSSGVTLIFYTNRKFVYVLLWTAVCHHTD